MDLFACGRFEVGMDVLEPYEPAVQEMEAYYKARCMPEELAQHLMLYLAKKRGKLLSGERESDSPVFTPDEKVASESANKGQETVVSSAEPDAVHQTAERTVGTTSDESVCAESDTEMQNYRLHPPLGNADPLVCTLVGAGAVTEPLIDAPCGAAEDIVFEEADEAVFEEADFEESDYMDEAEAGIEAEITPQVKDIAALESGLTMCCSPAEQPRVEDIRTPQAEWDSATDFSDIEYTGLPTNILDEINAYANGSVDLGENIDNYEEEAEEVCTPKRSEAEEVCTPQAEEVCTPQAEEVCTPKRSEAEVTQCRVDNHKQAELERKQIKQRALQAEREREKQLQAAYAQERARIDAQRKVQKKTIGQIQAAQKQVSAVEKQLRPVKAQSNAQQAQVSRSQAQVQPQQAQVSRSQAQVPAQRTVPSAASVQKQADYGAKTVPALTPREVEAQVKAQVAPQRKQVRAQVEPQRKQVSTSKAQTQPQQAQVSSKRYTQQDYACMPDKELYRVLTKFMRMHGVSEQLVPGDVVLREFGPATVARLVKKNKLICVSGSYTL